MYKINSDVSNDSVYILTIIIVCNFTVTCFLPHYPFTTFKYLGINTLPYYE